MRTACFLLISVVALTTAGAQMNMAGWADDGQVWLTWDDTTGGTAEYEVYAATSDFVAAGTVVGATLVGKVLPQDWQAVRLGLLVPGATFTIPNGGGGTLTLPGGRALFVDTPHATTARYYAAVQAGQTAVTATNATASITPNLNPVQCHVQANTTIAGHAVTVYAHWIDGRADHTDARPDYPVLGNLTFDGTAQVFALSEPLTGPPAQPAPAVIALHGGGGNWHTYVPGGKPNIGLSFQNAWLITFDNTAQTSFGPQTYAHAGYWELFDRFGAGWPALPNDALLVNYGQRRINWVLDWLLANHAIDPAAVSVLGHSGGGRGGSALVRSYPNRFAAFTGYSTAFPNGPSPPFGDPAQGLVFTAPGNPTTADLFDEGVLIAPGVRDAPFTRHVIGRGDMSAPSLWTIDQVNGATDVYENGPGMQLFWDTRQHATNTWGPAWFNMATALLGETLTRYRRDESYPHFREDDDDPVTPGRQPELGDGNPLNGDIEASWSGYYDWEQATIADLPTEWSCTMFVTALSAHVPDNFAGNRTCSVSIRRPQQFTPAPGTELEWELADAGAGTILQVGTVVPATDGLITVQDLTLFPDPQRVRLTVRTCASGTFAGTGEDLRFRVGVNGPLTACSILPARPGDLISLSLDSPGGTFDLLPPIVAGQFFTTGAANPQNGLFPTVWLALGANPPPVVLLDGTTGVIGPLALPAGGITLGPFVTFAGLDGQSMMLQGFSLTPTATNGFFASADAIELVFLP